MNKAIADYLLENKVATVCFTDENAKPYCINCFYVYDEASDVLIFKSSFGTRHEIFAKPLNAVAGTILPNKLSMANIKGVQFTGQIISESLAEGLKCNMIYSKAFPMSLLIPGYYWLVKLDFVKLTDNTLGFGNKTVWKREPKP